jgi:hypothetical protein
MSYRFLGYPKLPEFDPAWKVKCLSCAHGETSLSKIGVKYESVEVIRCRKQDGETGATSSAASAARLTDGICGPEARLWQAKEA